MLPAYNQPMQMAPQGQAPAAAGGKPERKNQTHLKGKNVHLRDPEEVDFRAKYEKVSTPSGGALDKLGMNAFATKKRHPFIWCCDNCLHKGFTRTYVVRYCYLKEIIYSIITGIIFSAATGK
jgi:hypothetical protein